MSENLLQKKCVPCEGGTTPLSISEVGRLLSDVKNWNASPDFKKISKEFRFKEFLDSIHFVNEVARIAESEGHHPDLSINYDNVTATLSTHAIGGVSLNDFILAAKLDQVYADQRGRDAD